MIFRTATIKGFHPNYVGPNDYISHDDPISALAWLGGFDDGLKQEHVLYCKQNNIEISNGYLLFKSEAARVEFLLRFS